MELTKKDIGAFIRSVRKEKGLKMEDLADEEISTTTISKIELGQKGVSDTKRIYLCEKLGLQFHQIPDLIEENAKQEKKKYLKLEYIEQTITLGDPRKGLKQLKEIKTKNSYMEAIIHYLKGRAYYYIDNSKVEEDQKRAKEHFRRAIAYVDQENGEDWNNIKAVSYNQLSKIAYYESNYKRALNYVDLGLSSYQKNADRPHIKYSLLMNKAIYLDKLDYTDATSKILDVLWTHENEIQYNVDVLLNMYDIQSNVYQKNEVYSKAIEYAKKGLNLARINAKYNRIVELLLTLGNSYMSIGKLDEAITTFLSALELQPHVKQKNLFLPIYSRLGKIYLLQGKPEKAKEILDTAIQEKSNSRNAVRFVDALIVFGNSLEKQGLWEEARNTYERALELTKKYSILRQEYDVLKHLSLYWKERDPKKFLKLIEKRFTIELKLEQRKRR